MTETAKVISFYRPNEKYGELSNFWEHHTPLIWHEMRVSTSEHIFQAKKYIYEGASPLSIKYGEVILRTNTPYKAKILANMEIGHRYTWRKVLNETIMDFKSRGLRKFRPDWHKIKLDEMFNVLQLKFQQDSHCRKVLLDTGSETEIQESTPTDEYWGTGRSGNGPNHLGKLLVKLRTQLLEEENE